MRRSLAFGVLAVLLLAGGLQAPAALEWGGTLYNKTEPTGAAIAQEDKLALWLEAAFGPRLSLAAQGSYTYSLKKPYLGDAEQRPYLVDLDLLRFQGLFPLRDSSVLDFSLGRFRAADFSGLLFDGNLDGAQAAWRQPRFSLALTVGYLGLQLKPVSRVSMSWADLNEASDPQVFWAPPRLLEMLQAEFPELWGRQSLLVAFAAQQDLRADDPLEGTDTEVLGQGGRLSTEYLGAWLRGPLAPGLYYDLFGYLGTGRTLSFLDGTYGYEWVLSGLLGAGLRWYQEKWLSSSAELRLLAATGDEDYETFLEGNREGLANAFSTISQPELGLLFSPRLGNLLLVEAGYSLKPVEILQTALKAALFLRPVRGPVSDAQVDPDSSSALLGAEFDLAARLRLFSDLGLAVTGGLFVPGVAFLEDSRELRYGVRMELSFSF